LGRTVEKYSQDKHKKITKGSTHSIPAFIGGNWVGLLKILLRPNVKGIKGAAHHSIPAFIGGIG
jgi:hypothetical protein